jgi:hypothetical protein
MGFGLTRLGWGVLAAQIAWGTREGPPGRFTGGSAHP